MNAIDPTDPRRALTEIEAEALRDRVYEAWCSDQYDLAIIADQLYAARLLANGPGAPWKALRLIDELVAQKRAIERHWGPS